MEVDAYIVRSDRQLVELALGGDNYAFEHLFDRYRDSILQLYLQRTATREDADDLLQETFVKVFLKLGSYDPQYTFGQWVYAVARNTFIDHVRKRRDNLPIENVAAGGPGVNPPSHLPNPEESIINLQQRSQIEAHLGNMPERYRRFIELRFFRDFSYKEIAAELGMPLGTVKTGIHRARELLCRFIRENSDILG